VVWVGEEVFGYSAVSLVYTLVDVGGLGVRVWSVGKIGGGAYSALLISGLC
jgi:hypothetical protein